ncbi:DUF5682 family protein [Leptolyngbya sp. AN03gr2]|uniref:DUF5682 family protein n=1 Tax=unclassified Leptolyngbya TaxID=2650499 RepID=UPI003D314CB9
MSIHVFGIRHHGPGSARSLRQALETLQPDIVLVEGPPDAESRLPLLIHAEMRPPAALLLYVVDHPEQAVYYPFAVFSPEWQAIQYGLQQQIPVRFMDLPQSHQFALAQTQPELERSTKIDPLNLLAEAAGYQDGERWWEHLVEQRQESTELFTAILEAMTVLRNEVQSEGESIENYREAFMRKTIREAEKQGFQNIAVVCGAWHSPALVKMPPAKEDTALLKGLPKLKVETTWVPWTYGRLSMSSGYGAGIHSPGWYHHLWKQGERKNASTLNSSIRWMTQVARLLRKQDLDASSASVIEAVRLAESLAALRDRALPGLEELNEATQTVLCFGDSLPMQLIHQQLIVGERLGKVPDETPMVPLQQDLQKQQKRLRLKPEAIETNLELDLRKATDLDRSQFLHRLLLLGLPWGKTQAVKGKGTFRESWRLHWKPEFTLKLIEAGIWGNTIEDASSALTCDRANRANLPELTKLIDQTLLANLPIAISHLMTRLESEAAIASDMTHLMEALLPLVNIIRYGNVRQFDAQIVQHVVDGLIARICIGLPIAVSSLDDDAAAKFYELIILVNSAIALLQNNEALETWRQVLATLSDQKGLHGLLAGRCCRLLFEANFFDTEETSRRLGLALSTATEPAQAAAWIEGFLSGSGLLLLHNLELWNVVDRWIIQLPSETFIAILPLLRRTFSTFAPAERRQMGEQVRQGETTVQTQISELNVDRADAILPLLAQLLGVQS